MRRQQTGGFLDSAASSAVFLSYASQDADAAQRICDGLRAGGIEVWFDRSELRGGDAWDQKIRQQIRDCALFVAVISANTAARAEGYFRLEWALAEQRAQRMARNRAFILPVCVDATHEGGADVPEAFTRVQWTRLLGGQVPAPFASRVRTLLGLSAASAAPPAATAATPDVATVPAAVAAPAGISPVARRPGPAVLVTLIACALALGVLIWRPWHMPSGHAAAAPQQAPAGGAPTPAAEQSVAVLPFADMSEKHDQEYFSDGLAEELIDALTRVPNLRVPARTSSFSFKGRQVTVGEIARALGVSHVLEGSVRKAGDRLRITAQLVRADNGFHLWSQTYDRDTRDIFAVQDDIARSVSQQLQTTLLGARVPAPQQSTSPAAYELYLKARQMAAADTNADLDRAVTLYHQALEIDPGYAPAWAWLAICHTRRVAQGLDTGGKGYAEATAAANRAIALNPSIPEAYVALGTARAQYERNWSAAADAFAKALALDPGNASVLTAYGHLSAAVGRPSDAVAYMRRAVQADPLNPLPSKYLGRALQYARQPAEAADVLRGVLATHPQFPAAHYELGRALLVSGDAAGASAAFRAETVDPAWGRISLPLAYAAIHDMPKARAALAELVADSSGGEFQVAETYAFLGDTDKAFEWLEKARMLHDPGVMWIRRDVLLASIAGDPRFAAYLQSLGMPPEQND
jgi:TolB-like protein/Tfp pilus assembly protein PilF